MARNHVLGVLFLLAACSACGVAESTVRLESNRDPVNFHKVTDFLYRSGRLDQTSVASVKGSGIRTVLSLDDYSSGSTTSDQERRWVEDAGMSFVGTPWSPSSRPTTTQIYAALEVIMNHDKQPVLVHCYRGSDRTGIAVAAYRIKYEGMSVPDAIAEMKKLGHTALLYWWDDVLNEIH